MIRETITIEDELRELVRLAQHFGKAAALKQDDAQELGTQTYAKLNAVTLHIAELRGEAYTAGVHDGESGESMRAGASK